jgi:hypothetical protein
LAGYLENYIIPEFGGFQPGRITRREIDDWLLVLKKKSGAELAGGSVGAEAGQYSGRCTGRVL